MLQYDSRYLLFNNFSGYLPAYGFINSIKNIFNISIITKYGHSNFLVCIHLER